jgi:hypothetical protein
MKQWQCKLRYFLLMLERKMSYYPQSFEACGGAHHWVRVLSEWGHTVKMIAPQFVKPYVKSNKNDAVDVSYYYSRFASLLF